MKTIRSNVFETNSSSTHSISIIKSDDQYSDRKSLVENNVLFPMRLYSHGLTLLDSESRILTCSTKDEKFSMLIHWLLDANSYKEDKSVHIDDNYTLADIPKLIEEIIPEKGGYDSINFESDSHYLELYPDFTPYSDEDGYILSNNTIDGIIEVCLNPDSIIQDSYLLW